MRFTREAVQESVNKYSTLIRRNLQIPLEDITVEETKFGRLSSAIMRTEYGKIFIDTTKEYSHVMVNGEKSTLHELGHRAVNAICPSFPNVVRKGLNQNIVSYAFGEGIPIELAIREGIAECFALDIFPSYFLLNSETVDFIQKTKKKHQKEVSLLFNPAGYGLPFFRSLYISNGLRGMFNYVKNLHPEQVPSRRELEVPVLYWERFQRQL